MADTVNLEQFISHAASQGPCVGILCETTLTIVPPAGFEVRTIDGAHARNRDALYAAFATAWHFPPWFGHNMDAFDDVMHDLDNLVNTATGKLQAAGYLTVITNAQHILADQPELLSWFANTMPFYRVYYRDELRPPATFALLLSVPTDQLDNVRKHWQSVGIEVALLSSIT